MSEFTNIIISSAMFSVLFSAGMIWLIKSRINTRHFMKHCLVILRRFSFLALLICSSCMSPKRQAELYYKAGVSKSQSGDQSGAIVYFSDAIKLDPKSDNLYLGRAASKVALNDIAEAINDYGNAIELNPNNEEAFFDRGLCKRGLKDLQGANTDFSAAIELWPNDVKALLYRGVVQWQLRKWDGAMADFNMVNGRPTPRWL